MNITLGKYQASMMNPPNDGTVIEAGKVWNIRRNGSGLIVLRDDKLKCHPQFIEGMSMSGFVHWINNAL